MKPHRVITREAATDYQLPSAPSYSHYQEQRLLAPLSWIEVARNAPYFATDQGQDWLPIGQNDAITWPDLAGAFRRRDMASVDAYLAYLVQHGVTCLRLMLEYCQGEHRYLERPVGHFQPNMVRLWDDLFARCEAHGLRILLTPYDTFWMWLRWGKHPYRTANGGPCAKRSQWLLNPQMRAAIKQRLAFATERWGHSGALFAWDVWNEIHPAHAEHSAEVFSEFVEDIGSFLRSTELRLHGRAHPQTVSVFGPTLDWDPRIAACVFQHSALDFANVHFYENNTIDHPKNTLDAAISTGRLTRNALAAMPANRPFFDSEHGPIHTFKDHRITLPEAFDDEYFRQMQWAHFASGGAGGGMRWPNRHPHVLTRGMREAQRALAEFASLIDWQQFRRRNWNEEIRLSDATCAACACGDEAQAIVWLIRTDHIGRDGRLRTDVEARAVQVDVPGLRAGRYRVTAWDTTRGTAVQIIDINHTGAEDLRVPTPPITTDLALAIRRVD